MHEQAALRFVSNGANAALSSNTFSLIVWLHPMELDQAASVLDLPATFRLMVEADGSVRATMQQSGDPEELSAVAPQALGAGEWALLVVVFDGSNGDLTVRVRQGEQPEAFGSASAPGFDTGAVGIAMTIGATPDLPAVVGHYGLLALRTEAVNAIDVEELWNHRWIHGPYSLDNSAAGGVMSTPLSCRWMIGHAMTTQPLDGGVPGSTHERAAIVDWPVTINNTHIFDRFEAHGPEYRVVRPVEFVSGFVHRSPFDPPVDGFFVRELPQIDKPLPDPPHVSVVAPRLRELASGPRGLLRVIASANSRGMQANDGSGLLGEEVGLAQGSYAAGFVGLNLSQTAGVLNRTAHLGRLPWFGFDARDHLPHRTGDVSHIDVTDFSRFWTGSGTPGPGPGHGIQIMPGGSYVLRCRPQGLIEADAPLMIDAYVLRFPGASTLRYVLNKHDRQGAAGTDVGAETTLSLDSTTLVHAINVAGGDEVIDATELHLAGEFTKQLEVGWACCWGTSSISLIETVAYDAGSDQTTIIFEHPFSSAPGDGELLRFGPWDFEVVKVEWPALDGQDPLDWRGLHVAAEDDGGAGVVVFAFSAWRPGVDGFVIGHAGWSGHGYTPQLDQSFEVPRQAWMQILEPDVWLQCYAQQQSEPSSMLDFTDAVRAALPEIEVAWLGDMEHGVGAFVNWDRYILENAEAADVAAISVLEDPRLGAQLDLYADGLRKDPNHISQRGVERLAALWTERLPLVALPGEPATPGDLNGDGAVDAADLLLLLGSWGPCAEPGNCPADLNDDEEVNVLDLLVLFGSWTR